MVDWTIKIRQMTFLKQFENIIFDICKAKFSLKMQINDYIGRSSSLFKIK